MGDLKKIERNTGCNELGLYSEAQVAKLFDIRPSTLARWRVDRKGPGYIKIGSTAWYRHEDLLRWIDLNVVEFDTRPVISPSPAVFEDGGPVEWDTVRIPDDITSKQQS